MLRTSSRSMVAYFLGLVTISVAGQTLAENAPGRVFRDCADCPWMVVIPAGTFTMGSPDSEKERFPSEGPQRKVRVAQFAIAKYKITAGEYATFLRETGRTAGERCIQQLRPADRHPAVPAVCANWHDAKAFAEWLSKKTGKAYRLASESEWEYAARAGTTTPFYSGETISIDQANYNGEKVYGNGQVGEYRQHLVPVGFFPPNPFGLHDMHGNVWEWVEDCWNDDYRRAPSDARAWLRGDCKRRVLRAGTWGSGPSELRSAFRFKFEPDFGAFFTGFRIARTIADPSDLPPDTARAEEVRPGRVIRDCPECPEMVVIPPGAFTMGSPETEEGRSSAEGPQRTVRIVAFALGKYEVTFAEWDACIAAGQCIHKPREMWGRDRQPVIDVSWEDAKSYVAWLGRRTGKTYRLPSEAEWEYAARAESTTPFSTGETISTKEAKYGASLSGIREGGAYRRQTVDVGSFPPNRFGLHDMHGNVSEWVDDCLNKNYGAAPNDGRAWLSGECYYRILRGGSWSSDLEDLRSAHRSRARKLGRDIDIGFRVARNLD